MWGWIIALIIGGVAGYIAERIMKVDHSLPVNIALGVAGAFLFNLIAWIVLGVTGGNIIWNLLAGIVGACALIWGWDRYQSRNN